MKLSNSDWVEIYYAVLDKKNSETVQDPSANRSETQKWTAQLQTILNTLSPDGQHMWEDNDS